MPELRKDPIVGRWVIISTDRAKRPADFVREPVKSKGGFCPFCAGNENKTPSEVLAYRPNGTGRDGSGWTALTSNSLSINFCRFAPKTATDYFPD